MGRAVRLERAGDPDVLEVVQVPRPSPGPGEVLIEVAAIGLNRAESMYRSDAYIEALKLPGGLGYEAAGTVAELGPGVEGLAVGDRVSTFSAHSMREYWSYGDWSVMPKRSVRRLPRGMSFRNGASIWNSWITSHLALTQVAVLRAGASVLVPAGASSTGLAAIQIARRAGCRVIATSRTARKRDQLFELGADEVVVTGEEEIGSGVLDRTRGRGVDVIFDPVGGAFAARLFEAAAPEATILVYGALAGTEFETPAFPMMVKSLTVRGFTIFDFAGSPQLGKAPNVSALERTVRELTEGFETNAFRPVVHDRNFTLDEIADAHRLMETGAQIGKIVVTT